MLRNLGSSFLDRAAKLAYGAVLLGTVPLLVRPFFTLLAPWVMSGPKLLASGDMPPRQQQLITVGLLGGHRSCAHNARPDVLAVLLPSAACTCSAAPPLAARRAR